MTLRPTVRSKWTTTYLTSRYFTQVVLSCGISFNVIHHLDGWWRETGKGLVLVPSTFSTSLMLTTVEIEDERKPTVAARQSVSCRALFKLAEEDKEEIM